MFPLLIRLLQDILASIEVLKANFNDVSGLGVDVDSESLSHYHAGAILRQAKGHEISPHSYWFVFRMNGAFRQIDSTASLLLAVSRSVKDGRSGFVSPKLHIVKVCFR